MANTVRKVKTFSWEEYLKEEWALRPMEEKKNKADYSKATRGITRKIRNSAMDHDFYSHLVQNVKL